MSPGRQGASSGIVLCQRKKDIESLMKMAYKGRVAGFLVICRMSQNQSFPPVERAAGDPTGEGTAAGDRGSKSVFRILLGGRRSIFRRMRTGRQDLGGRSTWYEEQLP